jgi:hypothetical protein
VESTSYIVSIGRVIEGQVGSLTAFVRSTISDVERALTNPKKQVVKFTRSVHVQASRDPQ